MLSNQWRIIRARNSERFDLCTTRDSKSDLQSFFYQLPGWLTSHRLTHAEQWGRTSVRWRLDFVGSIAKTLFTEHSYLPNN